MNSLSRFEGLIPLVALAAAAVAAGGRTGAAIGGVDAVLLLLGLVGLVGSRGLRRAAVRRVLPDRPVEAGADVRVSLVVDLPRVWPLLVLSLRDGAPPELGPTPSAQALSLSQRRISLQYTLRGLPRGVHRFEGASLRASDALRLMPSEIALRCPADLWVFPRRVALVPSLRRGASPGDALPRGTRDFQPGDAPARLHAARTAQRGFPQVREYDRPPGRERALLLWAPGAEPSDVELVLSCAASLAVSWLASDEAVGLAPGGALHGSLAPERGREQEQRILRLLASLAPQDLDAPSPPLAPGDAEPWLLTTRGDALAPPGGRLLRIGAQGGPGAIGRLSDLPALFGGGNP